jgi:hypothetical protein
MAISHGQEQIFLAALGSMDLTFTFASGDYNGPIVPLPVSMVLGFPINTTTASATITGVNRDDLTSPGFYTFTVSNPADWGLIFRMEYLYDG